MNERIIPEVGISQHTHSLYCISTRNDHYAHNTMPSVAPSSPLSPSPPPDALLRVVTIHNSASTQRGSLGTRYAISTIAKLVAHSTIILLCQIGCQAQTVIHFSEKYIHTSTLGECLALWVHGVEWTHLCFKICEVALRLDIVWGATPSSLKRYAVYIQGMSVGFI